MNEIIYGFYSIFAVGSSAFLTWAYDIEWILPLSFLAFTILGLIGLIVFYFGINRASIGYRQSTYWIALALFALFITAFTFVISISQPMSSYDGESTVSIFDLILFSIENGILAFLYCFLLSLLLKQKSSHAYHVPNILPRIKNK
jgi:hypothetical protein